MKIKFIKDYPSNVVDIKQGEIYEIVNKKEPDKWKTYVRYQIKLTAMNAIINVPEMFVEELN